MRDGSVYEGRVNVAFTSSLIPRAMTKGSRRTYIVRVDGTKFY